MNQAEIVLQKIAQQVSRRTSACNHHSANIGEVARRRVTFRRGEARVSLYAAETVIGVMASVVDGRLVFAVNRPDRIMLADVPVRGLTGTLPWPVFATRTATADVREWLVVKGAQHIQRLAPGAEEALFVAGNGVQFRACLDRDLVALTDVLVEFAASLPKVVLREPELDANRLPAALRPLAPLFDRWAVADDEERSRRVRRASVAQRHALVQTIAPYVEQIDAYLASFDPNPLPEEAIRMGELAEVAAEIRAREA